MTLRTLFALGCALMAVSACVVDPYGSGGYYGAQYPVYQGGGGYYGNAHPQYQGGGYYGNQRYQYQGGGYNSNDYGRRVWGG